MEALTEELRMRFFGGLRITLGASRLTDFTSRKSPALLAYLATSGQPHTREFLIGLLWGESSEKRARASLRTVLWDLRRQLGSFLVVDYHTISFNLQAPHWLDVAEFQKHLDTIPSLFSARPSLMETDSGTKLPTDAQADALQRAVELYGGDFLTGFYITNAPAFESWMLEQREQARQSTLRALHMLIAYYITHDMYLAGIDAATRLLMLDPWQEEAHRRLMHLLALSGQRSAALIQYETCRRILADELDVEPTVETKALYKSIQAGDLRQKQGASSRPYSHYIETKETPPERLWQALSPTEQSNIVKLTVFQGEFSQSAASFITKITPADLDVLTGSFALYHHTPERYLLNPSLRQFIEKSSPATQSEVEQQHSDYHLELLARYRDSLHGRQPNTALIELQRVWEDIEKAWIWAAIQCNTPKLDRAIDSLTRFLILKGLFQKGEELFAITGDYLRENCKVSESLDSLKILSRLMLERARYLNELAHYNQADGIAQTVIELAQSHQWTGLEAAAHRERGKSLWLRGGYAEAQAQLESALTQSRAVDESVLMADSLRHLGIVALQQDNYSTARARLEQALSLFRDLEEPRGEANTLNILGLLALRESKLTESKKHLEHALRLYQQIGDQHGEGKVRKNLGCIADARGDYAAAKAYYDEALIIARGVGDQQGEVEVLTDLALLFHHQGKNEVAWNYSLRAVGLAQAMGDQANEALASNALAHAFLGMGQLPKAIQFYKKALSLNRSLGQPSLAMEPLAGLAGAFLAADDLASALKCVEEILPQLKADASAGGHGPLRIYLACHEVLYALQDPRAQQLLDEARDIFKELSPRSQSD